MVRSLVLIAGTLIAAITDWRYQKTFNWLTYPGMVLGVALNAWERGGAGVEDALAGWGVCGGLLLVCYLFFDIGGGDVKLLAMMGAFLGWQRGLEALLWTFVLGAVFALATVIWRVGTIRLVRSVSRAVWLSLRTGSAVPLSAEERQWLQPRLLLAPAAFVATLLVEFPPSFLHD